MVAKKLEEAGYKVVQMIETECDNCGDYFVFPIDHEGNIVCSCGEFIFGVEEDEV